MDTTESFLHILSTNPDKLTEASDEELKDNLKNLHLRIQSSSIKLNANFTDYCINSEVLTSPSLIPYLCKIFASLFQNKKLFYFQNNQEKFIKFLSDEVLKATALSNFPLLHGLLALLSILLEKDCHHSKDVYIALASSSGSLIKVLESKEIPYICLLEATRSLHFLSYLSSDAINQVWNSQKEVLPSSVTAALQKVAIFHLKELLLKMQDNTISLQLETREISILASSYLSILYNLVICAPDEVLGGSILTTSLPYIFHGLPGNKIQEFDVGETQNLLDVYELTDGDSDSVSKGYTNKNRRKRLRRKRAQPTRLTVEMNPSPTSSPVNITRSLFIPNPKESSNLSLKPQWLRKETLENKEPISTLPKNEIMEENRQLDLDKLFLYRSLLTNSEEDSLEEIDIKKVGSTFSLLEARVRRAALILINSVINKAGKQNKFSFWPQLMCQNPSLMTAALRDPSICVRMSALQVVNTFLTDSQQVLKMAVDENKPGSYSTLGRQLGRSIRELHRCLILCLLSEKIPTVLVRILKTIELLIENVSYVDLKPGLLTKLITHVKSFLRYKEAVVKANAFSVMVSLLMKKPKLPELNDILLRYQTPAPESLVTPPLVRSPSPLEEDFPDSNDEGILCGNMDSVALTNEEELTSDSSCDSEKPKTMVSWIVHRCVDSLLLHDGRVGHGMYVQVQLQSLKVLNALVSQHLILIKSSIPLIQHVISVCCDVIFSPSPNEETNVSQLEIGIQQVSHDPAVVVEHSFILLSSLLGSLKSELENTTDTQNETSNDGPLSNNDALHLWLWALQHPLKPLLNRSIEASLFHINKVSEQNEKLETEKTPKFYAFPIKVASVAAASLCHLFPLILESLGESLLNEIIETIFYLLEHSEIELKLCGVRIVGFLSLYTSIQEHMKGPCLIRCAMILCSDVLSSKEKHVNKNRIIASWALANISAVLSFYRDTWDKMNYGECFLNQNLIRKLLTSCIEGCHDKDKIRPHTVRSIGNIIAFLSPQMASQPIVQEEINKCMKTLIECSICGNNMKMRWNACYALGNILASRNIDIKTASWRSSVITNLHLLVQDFKNYKVRIKACSALCFIESREAFKEEYIPVWKSFLNALDNARNIVDYHENLHRDELIHQICVGICHLVGLLYLEDLEHLTECLSFYKDNLKEAMADSNASLPSERVSCFIFGQERIKELEDSDVLTVSQETSLALLKEIFTLSLTL